MRTRMIIQTLAFRFTQAHIRGISGKKSEIRSPFFYGKHNIIFKVFWFTGMSSCAHIVYDFAFAFGLITRPMWTFSKKATKGKLEHFPLDLKTKLRNQLFSQKKSGFCLGMSQAHTKFIFHFSRFCGIRIWPSIIAAIFLISECIFQKIRKDAEIWAKHCRQKIGSVTFKFRNKAQNPNVFTEKFCPPKK